MRWNCLFSYQMEVSLFISCFETAVKTILKDIRFALLFAHRTPVCEGDGGGEPPCFHSTPHFCLIHFTGTTDNLLLLFFCIIRLSIWRMKLQLLQNYSLIHLSRNYFFIAWVLEMHNCFINCSNVFTLPFSLTLLGNAQIGGGQFLRVHPTIWPVLFLHWLFSETTPKGGPVTADFETFLGSTQNPLRWCGTGSSWQWQKSGKFALKVCYALVSSWKRNLL